MQNADSVEFWEKVTQNWWLYYMFCDLWVRLKFTSTRVHCWVSSARQCQQKWREITLWHTIETRRMNCQKKLNKPRNIQIRLKTCQNFFGNAVGGTAEVREKRGWASRTQRTPTSSPFFLFFYYSQTLVALKTLMRLLKFIVCSLAMYMKWKYI